MATAAMSAATALHHTSFTSPTAHAVPTSTGTMAAGSVRGRAPATHLLTAASRALRELLEVRAALVHVGVATLSRFLGLVVEQRRVAGELLDAGEAVVGRVHRRLDHAQRERAVVQHLVAPPHGLLFELFERDDDVDEAHLVGPLRVVLPAQEPHFPRQLLSDVAGEKAGAVAAVERPHAWPGLAEAGIVGRDGEIAHDVE